MSGILRAGVIGLRRGLNLVRVLHAMEGVEVAAVADLEHHLVEEVCRTYQVPRGCSTLEELLKTELDVVVLATPIPLHVPQAVQALERGVHVLAEVPAIASKAECETLIAVVERSGRHYMLAEECNYWASIDAVKRMHARGDFGTIFYAEAEYIRDLSHMRRDAQGRPTWRATMEPITYITHSIGPIMWITGQYPVEVTCAGTAGHFEPGYIDVQVALLRMTDGSLVRVTCSFANTHWGHFRYVFMGTKATLDTGSAETEFPRYWSPALPNLTGPVTLPVGTDLPGAPPVARAGGHGTSEWFMVKAFLEAVRTGAPSPIDVYDAIMYSLPGLYAAESARTGKVVQIPQYQEQRPRSRA